MYQFFLVSSAFLIGVAFGCSMPHGWKVKSITQRAKHAEIILYGKVIKSPSKWEITGSDIFPTLSKKKGIYQAKVEVYCIFKGGSMKRFLNITKFGYLPGHCVENHAIENEKGIFFVTYGDSGELSAQKVNMQKSILPATGKNLLEVMKATHTLKHEARSPIQDLRESSSNCPVLQLYTA